MYRGFSPTLTALSALALLMALVPTAQAAPPPVRIVLTFDDGPHTGEAGEPSLTLAIADVLKRKALNGVADNIKAAFFVQTGISYRGGARLGLEVIRALQKQGHVVGVHSGTVGGGEADHLDHVTLQQRGLLAGDLDRAKARLQEAGIQARFVRPTYRHFDTDVLQTYQSRQLKVILWDADSKDATGVLDPITGRMRPSRSTEVIETLKNGKESVPHAIAQGERQLVVLFHDICPETALHLGTYIRTIHQAAGEVAGNKYPVEFVTRTEDVEAILAKRNDEVDAEVASPAVVRPAPAQAEAPAASLPPGSASWSPPGMEGLIGFGGVLVVALVLLRLRRRPADVITPELPLPALEALLRQPHLTGAQAACITDCLRKLRPADLANIEFVTFLDDLEDAGGNVPVAPAAAVSDHVPLRAALREGQTREDAGHWRLTPEGADRLSELRSTSPEPGWAHFIHARLHEPLEVTCPTCGNVQTGHWFRPTLSCSRCHRRFPLRKSPVVTPRPRARLRPEAHAAGSPRLPAPPVMTHPAHDASGRTNGVETAPERRRFTDRSARRWLPRAAVVLSAAALLALGAFGTFRPRPAPATPGVIHQIIVDQLGYRPHSAKWVIFCWPQKGQFSDLPPFDPGKEFQVRREADNEVVFTGPIRPWNEGRTDNLSGDKVWQGDFSAVTAPGRYYVSIPGGTNPAARSFDFVIAEAVYAPVLKAAARMFFYQRCGMDQWLIHGGHWHHAACHCKKGQDRSAQLWDGEKGRPAGDPRDLSGGWHDAGDYSKYVEYVFGTLWDLMHAAEWYPAAFSDATKIPESGNGVPDILDEVKYELDWLLRMQLPDGSVLGKVGVPDYSLDEVSPPDLSTCPRYYAGPSTGATATAAAACALGARLLRPYEARYPGYPARLRAAAERAWDFLVAHPEHIRYADGGMGTPIRGANGAVLVGGEGSSNSNVTDAQERQLRVAAAAELFALTGKTGYQRYFDTNYNSADTTEDGHQPLRANAFSVGSSAWLQRGLVSYCLAPQAAPAVVSSVKTALKNGIERHLMAQADADPYRAHMDRDLYNWSSNFHKSSAGVLALWGVKLGVAPEREAAYPCAVPSVTDQMNSKPGEETPVESLAGVLDHAASVGLSPGTFWAATRMSRCREFCKPWRSPGTPSRSCGTRP